MMKINFSKLVPIRQLEGLSSNKYCLVEILSRFEKLGYPKKFYLKQ